MSMLQQQSSFGQGICACLRSPAQVKTGYGIAVHSFDTQMTSLATLRGLAGAIGLHLLLSDPASGGSVTTGGSFFDSPNLSRIAPALSNPPRDQLSYTVTVELHGPGGLARIRDDTSFI